MLKAELSRFQATRLNNGPASDSESFKSIHFTTSFESTPSFSVHISRDNKPTLDSIKNEDIELKTKMKHVDIYSH
jgi:hypothetical protein